MRPETIAQLSIRPRRVRTLVVDDEPLARDLMSGMVRRDPDLELIGVAASGSEALAAIEAYSPHLLLLDIQMPSLDGVSVAEQLVGTNSAPYIIFVTAHDAYALQAFEVAVRDYLVKPVSKARFAAAIRRAKQEICATLAEKPEPLIVKNGETLKSLLPNDIVWVGAANQYVCLHTIEKDEYIVSQSLRQFARSLSDKSFTRIHRSTLINKTHLVSISKTDGSYYALMTDDTRHAIARNRKSLLTELLTCARENALK